MITALSLNSEYVTFSKMIRILSVLSFAALIVLSIFYIFQVNKEVGERYLIEDYQKRIDVIAKNNQALEITLGETNSLDKLTAMIGGLNLERAEKVSYIKVLGNMVVTSR